ncbi:MAG: dockerin type I repeat-containing protein [Oscillospiraceae bacterium]|nr:dockerin type I repeat-containing protein [Oscillospiraceae bacterium]
MLGDVSGDGEISADDAQIVLQEYVNSLSGNLSTFSNELFTVADVNKDGEISVDDAQYILLYYGNTLTNTPVTWEELIQN